MSPASIARWARPVLAPAVVYDTDSTKATQHGHARSCGGRVHSPTRGATRRVKSVLIAERVQVKTTDQVDRQAYRVAVPAIDDAMRPFANFLWTLV